MSSASHLKMSTAIDTDRYYTPLAVASRALECAQLTSNPIICADTACGSGSLLTAAQEVLQAKYCIGIDNDLNAIRQLRRDRPEWRLYVGDLLKRHRAPPIAFPDATCGADLLVLNPPFSLGPRKYVSIKYLGHFVKCSIAMAHILRSLELFQPNHGVIAVVPESLLYSDTDQNARDLLEQKFSIAELLPLSIYTFKGARVNSSFIQLRTPARKPNTLQNTATVTNPIPTTVVRGGLQMHAFERVLSGTQVIHSTSLKAFANEGKAAIKVRTSAKAKGRISGWMLLLPRVGIPNEGAFRALFSADELQLSDCVIGMKFNTQGAAHNAQKLILKNWQGLLEQYRGTGARYTTIYRLVDWLYCIGIQDSSAMQEIQKIRLN